MPRVLPLALGAAAALHIALLVVLACLRAPYPFELEWQEGGMLDHALRVLAGEALYAEPTLAFAAFPYTPLYHYVAALSVTILGEGFLALRAVSILATLAVLALLFRHSRREGGSLLAGLLAAGLFAACYRFAGAWYDVGRVDMLSWALVLGGLYVLRFRRGRAAAAAAGLLLFLAFFAKQTALIPAAVLAVPAWRRDRREALVYLLACFGPVVLATLAYDLASGGWFRWYAFTLLAGHEVFGPRVLGFWIEVLASLGPGIAAVLLARMARGARNGDAHEREAKDSDANDWAGFTAAACVALVAVAWMGRMHEGGYDNTLIPACLAAALLFGPAVASGAMRGGGAGLLVAGLGLVQLAWLVYPPGPQLPSAADRREGERVVAQLAAVEGELFVPYQSYLARRAGKPPCIHYMAIEDLLKATADEPGSMRHERGQRFVDLLLEALDARRYGALILHEHRGDLGPILLRDYTSPRPLLDPATPTLFAPVTGFRARPNLIYWPR